MTWPDGVFIEEMNWGPIAIVQYFQALEIPYDRVVFLGAIERPERTIGTIDIFKWAGKLPSETQIQACIGDAATGVISIENLLVIGEFFDIWPKDVFLIDVEPGHEQAGEHLTKSLLLKIPEILDTLKNVVMNQGLEKNKVSLLEGDTLFSELNYEQRRR
jgi:hypothetical protein